MVLEGRAMVSLNDVWGNHSVLGSVGPGEVFAEVYACIPGEPLMVTVSAAENSTVLFLQAGRVLAAYEGGCAFQARLIRNWLTLCAQKNLQLARRSLHTGSKSIRGRLLSYFSECAKPAAIPLRFPITASSLRIISASTAALFAANYPKCGRRGWWTGIKTDLSLRGRIIPEDNPSEP